MAPILRCSGRDLPWIDPQAGGLGAALPASSGASGDSAASSEPEDEEPERKNVSTHAFPRPFSVAKYLRKLDAEAVRDAEGEAINGT